MLLVENILSTLPVGKNTYNIACEKICFKLPVKRVTFHVASGKYTFNIACGKIYFQHCLWEKILITLPVKKLFLVASEKRYFPCCQWKYTFNIVCGKKYFQHCQWKKDTFMSSVKTCISPKWKVKVTKVKMVTFTFVPWLAGGRCGDPVQDIWRFWGGRISSGVGAGGRLEQEPVPPSPSEDRSEKHILTFLWMDLAKRSDLIGMKECFG